MILARLARPSSLAPVLLAALVGVGCMQSDTKTTILADGSGTCSDTIAVDIAKTKELIETAKMFGFTGIPADLDVGKALELRYGEAALKAQLAATPGVEAKAVSSEVKDGKRVSKREFAFADFSALGRVAFETTTAELKKNDDGSFTLDMDAVGVVRAIAASFAGGGGADPAAGGADPQALLAMVGSTLGDFRVKRSFTLPGSIVETNGTKSEDGRTVTWSFASEDLAKAADPAKAPGKMSVRFKGDGLLLKPFKYSPRLEDLMKTPAVPAAKPDAPTTPGGAVPPAAPDKPAEPTKPTEPKPPEPAPAPSK